jgi:hypothetical protein
MQFVYFKPELYDGNGIFLEVDSKKHILTFHVLIIYLYFNLNNLVVLYIDWILYKVNVHMFTITDIWNAACLYTIL